jgi:hypothetical protein
MERAGGEAAETAQEGLTQDVSRRGGGPGRQAGALTPPGAAWRRAPAPAGRRPLLCPPSSPRCWRLSCGAAKAASRWVVARGGRRAPVRRARSRCERPPAAAAPPQAVPPPNLITLVPLAPTQPSVRAVCRAWRAAYDATVTQLVITGGCCGDRAGSARGAGYAAAGPTPGGVDGASDRREEGRRSGGGGGGGVGGGEGAAAADRGQVAAGPLPGAPPPPADPTPAPGERLPLVLPSLTACTLRGVAPAAAARVLAGLAACGAPLGEIALEGLPGPWAPALEAALLAAGAGLRALRVDACAVPVLPAGLAALSRLEVRGEVGCWGDAAHRKRRSSPSLPRHRPPAHAQ